MGAFRSDFSSSSKQTKTNGEAGDGEEGLEAKARRIERFRSGDANANEIDGAGIVSPVLFDACWGLEPSSLRYCVDQVM
ncbi:hypothetical protein BHE74_00041505 [Ensete ventricosum]|nr:hypothetical protein GW17_00045212 [Ensete ventricosum]RWW52099.1 hypothetical protein BHE74_00041505 [Ensete ventricosum]RZS17046.1 hypothetical protein BHM03_00049153 [Ensete ventricosum]